MTAADLVAFACGSGLVTTAEDLDLAERLAAEIVARREAYVDGLLQRKAGSVAVSRALDWGREATLLADVERARKHRATICDPAPRPADRAGALR
jgi:hypothetical protein